ncbi:Na+/H+ antiporter subunit E [Raineyella fluvialis]|uniref:Na+/H+ antiporter subunit E n=1 Tax=Raineyella fluvialis TaxID=2662261 RepID=A0A5Q2FDY0_9ACTN|nr:Na+/H+ antiporter subunit E [Raineyella fluvialis]QGF24978.1 Na+/H+ antiporter subunit E [Raineyella fluvialis]
MTQERRGAAAERTPTRRARPGGRSILIGVIVWCILWGQADLKTILGGLVVTGAVAWLFPLPVIRFRGRIRVLALVRLVLLTLVDLTVSSWRVAVLALAWRRPVRSAIVGVRLRTNSDLLIAMIVELIGLVPGSVVVEQMRVPAEVFVHVLDVRDGAHLEEAYASVRTVEERVIRAFGTDEEVAALAGPLSGQELG